MKKYFMQKSDYEYFQFENSQTFYMAAPCVYIGDHPSRTWSFLANMVPYSMMYDLKIIKL